MSHRPIMDAGPGLNFFSLNQERLLFATLGALAIPEVVKQEMEGKARQDKRFAPAKRVLDKVPPKFLEILSDDVTEEMSATVRRMEGMRIELRLRESKDLGETMVIAHAVIAAERGEQVTVLIDDTRGRRAAALEAGRLNRLRVVRPDLGSIALIDTLYVLRHAAGSANLPDRNAMRDLYGRLRGLDDGLLPIEKTDLMTLSVWTKGR